MKQTEITEKEMNQAMEEMECWSVQNHLGKCKKCKALILKEVEKTCEEEMWRIKEAILLIDDLDLAKKTIRKELEQRLVLKKGKQI